MAKKERKEKKEKPLEKMTAKELREMALGLEGIVGVHAMNKPELIKAIKEAKGIVEDKGSRAGEDVRAIKKKIRELRAAREALSDQGDRRRIQIIRRRISRLKKKTRRIAASG